MNRFLKALVIISFIGTPVLATQLGGCTTIQQVLSKKTDAKTLATALNLATGATKAVDLAVKNVDMSVATLQQLRVLNDGVHAALVSLQADQQAGRPLVFAGFNAAMDAFYAYANDQGISVPTS